MEVKLYVGCLGRLGRFLRSCLVFLTLKESNMPKGYMSKMGKPVKKKKKKKK